jgi:hypothetical protein
MMPFLFLLNVVLKVSPETAVTCIYTVLTNYQTMFVGFKVLTVVTVKSTVFWDVTLCSLVEIY